MNAKLFTFFSGLAIGIGIMTLLNIWNSSSNENFQELPKPYYKVLYENENVRVIEHIMEPKEKEPFHSHPKMYAYFLEDCVIRITNNDGSLTERAFKKGQSFLGGDLSHSILNIGETRLHSLIVELNE